MKTATRRIRVALAGNPNSGKTTIFNNLTGTRQHVGNYPGVTVEKKEGTCRHGEHELDIVDLPGTYSLTAYSIEEIIARDFVLEERPDVVVDVVDASNIERNLYLATQLMELGVPLVLAFNMSDMAQARGTEFDLERLSQLLDAPIVETVGHRNVGRDALLDAVVAVASSGRTRRVTAIPYGTEVEEEIGKLETLVQEDRELSQRYSSRWLALKLLEHDQDVLKHVKNPALVQAAKRSSEHLERVLGDHPEHLVADRRYGFISGACQEAVRTSVESRHTMSDRIDAVVTHRVLGLPIFLGLMYLLFSLTFTVGAPFMDWLEQGFAWLGGVLVRVWPADPGGPLLSLLADGVIGGVGGVIVFLPNILLLFAAIAILEDSGYMARAAFIMDRFMHKIGLHGKSFIPLVIGFGCSVPAIMATRTLESRRDRMTTLLVIPLMSCGARLPIYALIIPAFFPSHWHAPVLWIVYLIGIMLAVGAAKLLRTTLFRGETMPFVMELPPYRMPTLLGIAIHMWERSWLYLKKAGTIILGVSIVMWALTTYPTKPVYDRDYEALADETEAAYVEAVRGLNATFELPGDSDGLIEALESGGGADSVGLFVEMVDRVTRVRAAFAIEAEASGALPGSLEYVSLEERLGTALHAIEERDEAVYTAVVRYLDEMKGVRDDGLHAIERARTAEELAYTVSGRIGRALGPVLRPLGFDWRIGTALVGAFAAKEVFVAQLGIVFSVGEADEDSDALRSKLRATYPPLTAFCIMLFCLISAPCMATVAVTRRESGSWWWALFQFSGLTVLAYVVTLVVYQLGQLFEVGVV